MSLNNSRHTRPFSAAKLIVAALLVIGVAGNVSAETKTGAAFPALNSAGLEGSAIPATLGKVTLVDFWASWCEPCRESFPSYAQLQTDYAGRGLVIVAISVDQNARAFEMFVKKMNPSFPTLRDKDHQLVRKVDVPAMPTCYLVGRDGKVRFVHAGFHGATTERELRNEIDRLLTETAPAS